TSLDAIRILAQIHQVTGVEIPIGDFVAQPSLGRVADLVQRQLTSGAGRASLVAGEATSADAAPTDAAALTFAEEQLWLLDQLIPRPESLNIGEAYRIRGDLDGPRLARALAHVCRGHDALRAAFPERDGRPWPQIRPASSVRA